jgi:hypothetical protein
MGSVECSRGDTAEPGVASTGWMHRCSSRNIAANVFSRLPRYAILIATLLIVDCTATQPTVRACTHEQPASKPHTDTTPPTVVDTAHLQVVLVGGSDACVEYPMNKLAEHLTQRPRFDDHTQLALVEDLQGHTIVRH